MSNQDSAYADERPIRTAYNSNQGRLNGAGQQSQQTQLSTATAQIGTPNNFSQKHPPPSTMLSLIGTATPSETCVQTAKIQPPPKPQQQKNVYTQVGTTSVTTESGANSLELEQPPEELDLVAFIKKHLKRGKKAFPYKISDLEQLVQMAVDSFHQQQTLVEILGPICVCGDIHGQYSDLMRIFTACGPPHKTRYLFLGDFVDRGSHSLEVISLLFACKIQYPDHIFLLRGNHELIHINTQYGFQEELHFRFGMEEGNILWYRFNDVFTYMPLAATIGGKILCMHGGISPHLKSLDDIRNLERPIKQVLDAGLVQDLLWSDPSPNPALRGYAKNVYRNCSVMFGEEALLIKLKLLKIDCVLRAHQVEQYGYGTFAKGKLITVFSAPRYHQEMNNWAAVAHVSADLQISFTLFKPPDQFAVKAQQEAENKKCISY